MKLYERIENNNFDEININRAIELIEGGNEHLVYNENYFKLQKENEELKEKNNKLMEELNLTTVYISGVYDGEKKVEDKIKAKIEELDDLNSPFAQRVINAKEFT